MQGTHLANSFILATLLLGGPTAGPGAVTDNFLLQVGTRIWTEMPTSLKGSIRSSKLTYNLGYFEESSSSSREVYRILKPDGNNTNMEGESVTDL